MKRLVLKSLCFLAMVGCSASKGSSGTFTSSAASSGAGGASSSSAADAASTGASMGGFNPGSGGTGGGSDVVAEVFGHSADTLYKLDPVSKAVTTVGAFQGCGVVIDIALDKSGKMYGTSPDSLYAIDKTNAKCTTIASNGSYPNSLSFVPAGTVDPNDEALVGYNGSIYVRIDKVTGASTDIGQIQGGYASSGDIVSVINGGTYLTVNGNNCNDCIIEVDPKTGDLKKMIGPLNHAGVYGLAFWAGVAYGFDDAGELFQIDLTNGSTSPIQLSGMMVSSFYGAGSTTAAPVNPPH